MKAVSHLQDALLHHYYCSHFEKLLLRRKLQNFEAPGFRKRRYSLSNPLVKIVKIVKVVKVKKEIQKNIKNTDLFLDPECDNVFNSYLRTLSDCTGTSKNTSTSTKALSELAG